MLETLRVVFALGHKDEVRCTLFSSPLRGDTPASERPEVSDGADDEHLPTSLASGGAPAVLRQGRGHHGDLDANPSAARAGRAWLLAAGLAAEIERLRRPLGRPPIAAPGLEDLLEIAEGAAIGAHEEAVEAHEAALAGDWDRAESSRESAQNFAELAERAARQIAMLALGVSAWHGSDLYIEATDRAAVTVLSPGIGLGQLRPGELELFATKRSELVPEIAGLLCVLLVARTLAVRVGPARIWCDGSDALHVVLDGHDDDLSWPSPVSVWEPATLVVDADRRRRRQHSRPSSVRSQMTNEVRLPPSATRRARSGTGGTAMPPLPGAGGSSRSCTGYRPATCLSRPNAARSPSVGAWWSPISRATPAPRATGASALSVLCEKSSSRPDLGVAKRIRYESPALPHHP